MILTSFMIALNGLIVLASFYLMYHPRKLGPSDEPLCFRPYAPAALPFETPSYLDHMEKAHLDLLRERQPVDWTITLWLGLDGLRIDPYGTSEWIRREPFQAAPPPLLFAPSWDQRRICAPHWLLTQPPLRYGGTLRADNRAVLSCRTDSEEYMRIQLDKLRIEYETARLRAQLDRIKNQKNCE